MNINEGRRRLGLAPFPATVRPVNSEDSRVPGVNATSWATSQRSRRESWGTSPAMSVGMSWIRVPPRATFRS